MRTVQRGQGSGPAIGLVGVLVVLSAVAATTGLGASGWAVGVASGVAVTSALAVGLARGQADGLGAADRVTLTRAALVCAVAGLTADAFTRPAPVGLLVTLVVVALVLDAVDGLVARSTGTVSALGARFDMEVDAFLILVLSVYVAPDTGWWVLVIGLARYARLLGGWCLPWLAGQAPPRYWGKVVAAVQGVVLATVAADVLPGGVAVGALIAATALLAESFGREVGWLWLHRPVRSAPLRRQPVTSGHSASGVDL